MINPAEDIVNIWLQECKHHFTMNNVVVRRENKKIGNKLIGGGRGKEIDIISTNGKVYYWIEISVSANPRLERKSVRLEKSVNMVIQKFHHSKEQYLRDRFGNKKFHKWFIYSHKLFPKNTDEMAKFCKILKDNGINAISFNEILNEVYMKLNNMGYDVTRNYLYLLKKFNYGISESYRS